MSEYLECETQIKDKKGLVAALVAMGIPEDKIEIPDAPQHLYGYHDDRRQQTADVIIRRGTVGSSSNDIGFVKGADGKFKAIISEYDRRAGGNHARHTGGYNQKWEKELEGRYAEAMYTKQAKKLGGTVKKIVKDRKIKLTIEY